MEKEELYEKYLVALKERLELEKKLGQMINNWVNGDSTLNAVIVEDLLDKGYKRLDELKASEQELLGLYKGQDESNGMKR